MPVEVEKYNSPCWWEGALVVFLQQEVNNLKEFSLPAANTDLLVVENFRNCCLFLPSG